MQRVTRIAGSFAIVVIVYWAYALLAVPWIEPPPLQPATVAGRGSSEPQPTEEALEGQIKAIRDFFPPGSWELKDPMIFESGQAKLLLQKYRNLGDGRVEINPCAIVFPYEGPAENEAQRHRQTIILEAPEGAVLKFDQPLDLGRAKMGRLMGGQLKGAVTIHSDWKQPGPEDDLLITTRDIQLAERTIYTPNPVDFRWGPHFGRGQEMLIRLLAGDDKPGDPASGPNIAGIEYFEIRHVERLHLDLQSAEPGPKTEQERGSVPVEIHCRGPFRFDMVRRVATFRDGVDVMKQNPFGPSDQIACELLSLYFVEPPKSKSNSPRPTLPGTVAARGPAASSLNLVAERIEARGNPAVVTAPSEKLAARGPRIEYNLLARSIALDGSQDVFVQRGPSEIHARSLQYQSVGEGRLGLVTALGPGWLRGQPEGRPDQQLEAAWKDQLLIRPRQQYQEISLTGGAELKFQGFGQLQAGEIFFWLVETPAASKGSQFGLRPNSMLARNDVHMYSPRFAGRVEQLEAWFSEVIGGPDSGIGGQRAVGRERPATVAVEEGGAKSGIGPVEVAGRLLRVHLLLSGQQQAAISNLTIEDGVQFLETQTSQPGERPMVIRGDRLEAANVSAPNATVTISGRPARFEGRGLGLTGSNISLDRGQNRLSIDGPGQMDLPLSADLQGQPLAVPAALTVDWQGSMHFDGSKAAFDQSVVAAAPRLQSQAETMQFELHTAKMDVQLRQPISFSEPNPQVPPQVEQVRCCGGAYMENRVFDAGRQLSSFMRLQVADLGINVLSGEMLAGGPGWLNNVRRGADNPFGSAAGSAAVPATLTGQGARDPELQCLHVKFQRSITGNLLRRQMTFHDQVRTAYGPASGWDAMLATENPDQLGPRGATVRCDQLSVVQMLLPAGGSRAVELEALGNTVVENATFIARGNRITYAEAKSLLILEGNGLSDAELWRQLQVGSPASKTVAKKIWYWPKTNHLKVDGARSLELGQLPGGVGK